LGKNLNPQKYKFKKGGCLKKLYSNNYEISKEIIDQIYISQNNLLSNYVVLDNPLFDDHDNVIELLLLIYIYPRFPTSMTLAYSRQEGTNNFNLLTNVDTICDDIEILEILEKKIRKKISIEKRKDDSSFTELVLTFNKMELELFGFRYITTDYEDKLENHLKKIDYIKDDLFVINDKKWYIIIKFELYYKIFILNDINDIIYNKALQTFNILRIDDYDLIYAHQEMPTIMVYDDNFDSMAINMGDIVYISDILPSQLVEFTDLLLANTTPNDLFEYKINENFIKFILLFLLSEFIINYNIYQFIIYILFHDYVQINQSKFYLYKLLECINFICRAHIEEYKTRILEIIENNKWSVGDFDIFDLINSAVIHFMSMQDDHNLFDCSDNYKHGIIPPESIESFSSNFDIFSDTGRGASSIVYICTLKSNPSYQYILKGNCMDDRETVLRIDHPFIVKYFAIYPKIVEATGTGCILERCIPIIGDDNYFNYFGKQILTQLIFALCYLENNHIKHGDLHINNMMIGRDGYFRLIDFDRTLSPNMDDYAAFKNLLIGSGRGSSVLTIAPFKSIIDIYRDEHLDSFLDIIRASPYTFNQLKQHNWLKFSNGSDKYYNFLLKKEENYYQ
jgi:hypothetical protein